LFGCVLGMRWRRSAASGRCGLWPHVERLLGEVGGIAQPSVMWHVAQMLAHLHGRLSNAQARRAAELLKRNLVGSGDWIVLNVTMDVLVDWAPSDTDLAVWVTGELERLRLDTHRSVAKRASERLAELTAAR